MGCNIHLHIEIKIHGRWHHYGNPNISRDYALFEKMAGVRGDSDNAVAQPKGIPADVTLITRLDAAHWASDGHSHSWLGVDEIIYLEDWLNSRSDDIMELLRKYDLEHSILHTYLGGNSFTGWKKYNDPLNERHYLQEDVRFIFWFDN